MNSMEKLELEGNARSEIARLASASAIDTLEGLLEALSKRGFPRLSKHNTGWYCCIEMFVSATGAEFKIQSEFGHVTPIAAAKECHSRMVEALRTLDA